VSEEVSGFRHLQSGSKATIYKKELDTEFDLKAGSRGDFKFNFSSVLEAALSRRPEGRKI
jgi:hypothetical protein